MLEKMADFFNARVDDYEEHMLTCIDRAEEYYRETVKCFPVTERLRLLDLGCGTGLELDGLFEIMPDMQVTGVDMAGAMLEKLREKHRGRDLTLIQGDYFKAELPENFFDAAVAVQTVHHFRDAEKIRLYRKILSALREGGLYVETDYVAKDEAEEQAMLREADRLLSDAGDGEELYHIDIPFTVEHQMRLMREAGFREVDLAWRIPNTAVITARK